MQNTLTKEMLIQEFTKQYTGSLFYFCLRKTGNSYEAEDLVSDIALNVLTALQKGILPQSFSAWMWQIARNRYSVWADKKRKRTDAQTEYVIDRVKWLYDHRHLVGGLRFVHEPKTLRFFTGKLEPVSDWPEKLLEAYMADFGEDQ